MTILQASIKLGVPTKLLYKRIESLINVKNEDIFETEIPDSVWNKLNEEYLEYTKELLCLDKIKLGISKNIAIKRYPPVVYFLFKDLELVYIGQTINLIQRIADHFDSGKEFNGIACIPCNRNELLKKEAAYINMLRPPLNLTHVSTKSIVRRMIKKPEQVL